MTPDTDPRLACIAARDRKADGLFWYSVVTTGVYCRPSCPGRAKPENIRLHTTLAEARATGRRPCKRCKPEVVANPPHQGEGINPAIISRISAPRSA